MATIELCPRCGTVAFPVPFETVRNMARSAGLADPTQKWYACTNGDCDVAYCSRGKTVLAAEINVRLWYKDSGEDVPVCYCSYLTRDEIRNAVAKGAITIDDVQEFTGKNITGKCATENPLGQCCRNVFLRTIVDARKAEAKKQRIDL